jgi:hypothetical protein
MPCPSHPPRLDHSKYNHDDQIKEDEMGGACSTHESEEDCIQGTDGKARGNKPLGGYRRRWEDIIKMDLK